MNSTNFRTATPTQNHRFFLQNELAVLPTQEKTSENPQPKCFEKISVDRLVRPLHLIPNQKNHHLVKTGPVSLSICHHARGWQSGKNPTTAGEILQFQ